MPKGPKLTEYGERYYSDSLSKEEQKALHKWRMKNDLDYKNQIAIERKKKKTTTKKTKSSAAKPKTTKPKVSTKRPTTRSGMRGGGAGLTGGLGSSGAMAGRKVKI